MSPRRFLKKPAFTGHPTWDLQDLVVTLVN
jgi:hypothetical protein